jgi:xylulokinase
VRRSGASARGLFLGLDCSTQGLTACAIDRSLNIVHHAAINYDKDLPHYGTKHGVLVEGKVVRQPTRMFVDALETLLDRMRSDGFPFEEVVAVSGAAQQHGSCYWNERAEGWLREPPSGRLSDSIDDCLSVSLSPIWMDSSTSEQCTDLEALVGRDVLARITGSRAYERFTLPQIMRLVETDPEAAASVHRVSLISSFMASLLVGRVAPIDWSDGSGMNLLDLQARQWSDVILGALPFGERLSVWLGEPVSPTAVLGPVAPWVQRRFGFSEDCVVTAWSGDNPNSAAGLRLERPGDVAVSLGTSDTVFGIASRPPSEPCMDGHVFVAPCNPTSTVMLMACFKNGSLTRQRVRDVHFSFSRSSIATLSPHLADKVRWDTFDEALASTVPGNDRVLGVFHDLPEIAPSGIAPGDSLSLVDGVSHLRVDSLEALVSRGLVTSAQLVRAVVESQCASIKVHSELLGIPRPDRVLVTGGASQSVQLCQVLADVYQAPVHRASTHTSAALGAAYRALHASQHGSDAPFEAIGSPPSLALVATPRKELASTYEVLTSSLWAMWDQLRAE